MNNNQPRPKNDNHPLPQWGVKAIYRLAQKASRPGIYPLTLIVTPDGRRQLVIEGGKVEDLGRQ